MLAMKLLLSMLEFLVKQLLKEQTDFMEFKQSLYLQLNLAFLREFIERVVIFHSQFIHPNHQNLVVEKSLIGSFQRMQNF